jgi:hypothetical protein
MGEHATCRAALLARWVDAAVALLRCGYCQLEQAMSDQDGTKAGQSQEGDAAQAMADTPVTARQVAKRSALVAR